MDNLTHKINSYRIPQLPYTVHDPFRRVRAGLRAIVTQAPRTLPSHRPEVTVPVVRYRSPNGAHHLP